MSGIKEILLSGNERYVLGNLRSKNLSIEYRKELSEKGQHPLAVIISCSDSRVPPEIIFDLGLGEAFVIRNAGNLVEDVVIETAEYAVKFLGVKLIMVMAHEKCGAVKYACESHNENNEFKKLYREISPSIEKVKNQGEKHFSKDNFIEQVENENAKHSAKKLLQSTLIKSYVDKKDLEIVTAKYSLTTGEVIILP